MEYDGGARRPARSHPLRKGESARLSGAAVGNGPASAELAADPSDEGSAEGSPALKHGQVQDSVKLRDLVEVGSLSPHDELRPRDRPRRPSGVSSPP